MTCSAGQVTCDGGCTNTQTDAENCGACNNRCPTGNACMAGVCRVACVAGQTLCAGGCADTLTSNLHCGACGNACGAGEQCMAGAARSPAARRRWCAAPSAPSSRATPTTAACAAVCPTGCFDGACARVDTLEAGESTTTARATRAGASSAGGVTAQQHHDAGDAHRRGRRLGPPRDAGRSSSPPGGRPPGERRAGGARRATTGCARGHRRRGAYCWGFGVGDGGRVGPADGGAAHRAGDATSAASRGRAGVLLGRAPARHDGAALIAPVTLASAPVEVVPRRHVHLRALADRRRAVLGDGHLGAARQRRLGDERDARCRARAHRRRRPSPRARLRLRPPHRPAGGVLGRQQPTASSATAPPTATPRHRDGPHGARCSCAAGLRHACADLRQARCAAGATTSGQLGDGTTTDRRPRGGAGLLRCSSCASRPTTTTPAWWASTAASSAGAATPSARPTAARSSTPTPRSRCSSGRRPRGPRRARGGPGGQTARSWRPRSGAARSTATAACSAGAARNNGNESGQLGDGTTTQRAAPQPVTGLTDATQIAVGWLHACALRRGGTVVCWGSNAQGSSATAPPPTARAGGRCRGSPGWRRSAPGTTHLRAAHERRGPLLGAQLLRRARRRHRSSRARCGRSPSWPRRRPSACCSSRSSSCGPFCTCSPRLPSTPRTRRLRS
jgi:hypothetical protein